MGHFAFLDFATAIFETVMKSKSPREVTDAGRAAYRHAALTLIAINGFRGPHGPGSDTVARVVRLAREALEPN